MADFGLARALAEAAWTEPQGAVMGTARYASPEQAQGEPVDGRADVYSLGLTLIEAVTGTVPFAADTTIATLMARVGKPVEVPDTLGPLQRPLAKAGLPNAVDRPDAGALAVSFMASAGELPRPEPLPLVTSATAVGSPVQDDDDTMHGRGGGGADSPSRLAQPGEVTVVDGLPALGAPVPVFLDDDLVGYEDERRRRRWPWVVLAVLLAGAIGGGGAWAWFQSRTPTYDVPALVGLTEEAARAAVDEYGFEIDRQTTRQDDSTAGTVLETDPARGEELEKGGTLVLVISLGNTLAPLPSDLVGMPVADATAALEEAGGFVPIVTEVFDEAAPTGTVMAVGPDLAPQLPKGSEVPLTVSKGPEPRTVPEGLAGKTYDQAAAALGAVQLGAKKVEEFSDTVPAGQVIGTRPGGGEQAARDTVIDVVISKGPDLVKVPAVAGKTLDGAIAALEAAGLKAGDVHGPAAGRPFETDPPVGTSVKRGATVDIFLRR